MDRRDMAKATPPRGNCLGCSIEYALYQGTGEHKGELVVRKHLSRVGPGECKGSKKPPLNGQVLSDSGTATSPDPFTSPAPVPEMAEWDVSDSPVLGPWFRAGYDADCDGTCGGSITEGEEIRADGQGGWLCSDCGADEQVRVETRVPAPVVNDGDADGRADLVPDSTLSPVLTAVVAPETAALVANAVGLTQTVDALASEVLNPAPAQPDPFTGPGASSDIPESDTTVSGQPDPDRDRWGRYVMQGQSYTRATTFAKMGSNTFAIGQWEERNVIVGLTKRPDLLALAEGLEVKRHRDQLNKIAEQAKDAAGQKIAANLGTAYHAFTERLDAGLITLADVPEKYRRRVQQYAQTVHGAGLVTRPEWIERTTAVTAEMVSAPVPVAGTLDRIFQLPDGSRVIGDLKTGSSLEYGMAEIEVQLAVYAHGVNRFGLFDWNTKTWQPVNAMGDTVRTDFAIVIHLPADGDGCKLIRVDLERGWERARLRGQIQFDQKAKSHPQMLTRDDLAPRPVPAERGEVAEYMAAVVAQPVVVQAEPAPDPWDAPHMGKARELILAAPDRSTVAGLFQYALDSGKFSAQELGLMKSLGMKRLRDLGLM